MPSRRSAVAFALTNLFTSALLVVGVFGGLPARWLPVDIAAGTLIALQLASAVGMLVQAKWAVRAAQLAAASGLMVGLVLVTALAVTATWLFGIYGPVGRGGAIVMTLVAALALPYLVVIPVVELVWLRPRGKPHP
jgi:hypothetical protein